TNPADALIARADASAAFESLFLGLGAVALLVGGIGIANVMVIAVLERRGEIGLRRALGASRWHVGVQFVAEAALLAGSGGVAGAILGGFATTVDSAPRPWRTVGPGPALRAAAGGPVGGGAVPGAARGQARAGGGAEDGLARALHRPPRLAPKSARDRVSRREWSYDRATSTAMSLDVVVRGITIPPEELSWRFSRSPGP